MNACLVPLFRVFFRPPLNKLRKVQTPLPLRRLSLLAVLCLAPGLSRARAEGPVAPKIGSPSAAAQLGQDLLYSTHFGGGYTDGSYAVAMSGGLIYIAGRADNADATANPFPLTPGAFDTSPNGPAGYTDAFVAVLAPNGHGTADLLYSTLLGGASWDVAHDIAVDGARVYVTGITSSQNFPTTAGAYAHPASDDFSNNAFVAVFDSTLSTLHYSTLLKGSDWDEGDCLALAEGEVIVAGETKSSNFPVTPGAFETTFTGVRDVWVAVVDPDLSGAASLRYSTFLGQGGLAEASCLVATGGNAYLTGNTGSTSGFPTTLGAYDTSPAGAVETFVSVLDPGGNGAADLLYSTLLGGSDDDWGHGIAVGGGKVFVTGNTDWEKNRPMTALFPTTFGAFDRLLGDGWMPLDFDTSDAFLSVFDATLSSLLYSTFLGGSSSDAGQAVVALDGKAYLTGSTYADPTVDELFPTTAGAFDTTDNGVTDSFLVVLDPSGFGATDLVYSTLLGGSSFDRGSDLALSGGRLAIAGTTDSVTVAFPTTVGAFDETPNGFVDGFVTVLPNLSLLFEDGFERGDLSAWSGN